MNTSTTHRTILLSAALLAAVAMAPMNSTARPRPSAELPAGPLPFLQDDYAAALAQARAASKPLFMEFWAPW
jgi:hypothetical protein